ncbi:uncharacterized protein [Anoplolepis gracilipes]|uniref:uncharacterized protein isoform X2 n=1 Tax=Anoplolepis gracilipes TaxID=354296 RepID=UPI003BA29638
MGRACCVLGCPSGGDAPSHQIPKNPTLFQKWKNMIYSEKIQHLTDEQISKCAVCYRHFADDDYLVTFRVRKLKRGIAPSLNLPNKLATNNCKSSIITTQTETDLDTGMFLENLETESQEAEMEVTESQEAETELPEIVLFEDLPEEPYFRKQLQKLSSDKHSIKQILPDKHNIKQISLDKHNIKQTISSDKHNIKQTSLDKRNIKQILLDKHNMKQSNLTEEAFKLYCKRRALRRKQRKLMTMKFELLRFKKQAEQYEKTPTIQKLLSSLTPAEIALVKAKIRMSRYSPRVYTTINIEWL